MSIRMSVCALLVIAFALSPVFAAEGDSMSVKEKRSYCVGLDIGQNLKSNQYDLEVEQLINGIRDAFTGAEWKVQKDEMMRVIQEYRTELNQKAQKIQAEQSQANMEAGKKYLDENAKKPGIVVLPSGLQYEIITPGTGNKPLATDTVQVHYTGTLIDGTEFDSSHTRGQPATFGVDKVIKGWTEALQLMKEGAKWRVFIPSDLAYGPRGAGPKIGPHSTLIFEVELLKVNP